MEENDALFKQLRNMPSKDMMDPNYTRIRYIRYTDDFVIMVIGSLELARQIRSDISAFLGEKLKLELNMGKTIITDILKDKTRFLGYEISRIKNDGYMIRDSIGRRRRSVNGIIQLTIPTKVINSKIKPFTRNGKPFHRKDRINLTVKKNLKKHIENLK